MESGPRAIRRPETSPGEAVLESPRDEIDSSRNRAASQPPSNLNASGPYQTVRPITSSQHTMLKLARPTSDEELLVIVREAVEVARREAQVAQVSDTDADNAEVGGRLKPGLTIDLGHKQIEKFTEDVVNVIKDDIERLALPHNQIRQFPSNFAQCSHLRYLNVRYNDLRSFPNTICELASLEILDLSRNSLQEIPDAIGNLTSLKVLSVQKNKLERLPFCLGNITTLQVLKLEGNPLIFPPKSILELEDKRQIPVLDSEKDTLITVQVKRFLRQAAVSGKSGNESGAESSGEGPVEQPRVSKRTGGRFPVKPSISGIDPMTALGLSSKPPPIPERSHHRMQSQQNSVARRPGIAPLALGNERNRSNSESILQANNRMKRMGGIITRKPSDLSTLNEVGTNRLSHYRGLSHGSILRGKDSGDVRSGNSSSSPASPIENERHRNVFINRLSSLPEYKRQSDSPSPLVQAAKSVLYSMFQLHPHISSLLALARDGPSKRSSLERVFYNATTHVGELDREIHKFDNFEEDEEGPPQSSEGVERACLTCIKAYEHVISLLVGNASKIIEQGDQKYIRTLLLLVFGGLVEIRNATSHLRSKISISRRRFVPRRVAAPMFRRGRSATPTRERPAPGTRMRSGTVIQHGSALQPINTQPPLPFKYAGSRSNTLTNGFSFTPRSTDTFPAVPTPTVRSRNNTMLGHGEVIDEERLFEKIYLRLSTGCDSVLNALPAIRLHFLRCSETANAKGASSSVRGSWTDLCDKSMASINVTDQLKHCLSTIKLKDPNIRSQREFWQLCHNWLKAFVDLAFLVKEARSYDLIPNDVLHALRLPQKQLREVGALITQSPWSELGSQSATIPPLQPGMTHSGFLGPSALGVSMSPLGAIAAPTSATSVAPNSSPYVTPLPATPLSAALGPAVQATVPSTPSGTMNSPGFFPGGALYERTESLASSQGRR
ncbi:hypothetical protein L228DRAFT_280952 [Xylona heveae TC161]|uniref:Disease resistance R13L4/SHOC-2-like LRR domain-containing protein n=1 Tax=Xylona heveae (strain CBS 132557 / TC161) TaxID=1328760 RepID=A0A165J4S9_XYLHT|nr:hypothetical protein L228DRAFT_280952 [Xylona heveae TC161]KZF25732.1 hypothetical protein L228DRAFT_280952 [Xylona heveae TC161]